MNNLNQKQLPVRTACATRLWPLLLLLLLTLPAVVQAQFNYTTNNGTITIIGYTGPGGAVTIPNTINGLPVTTIGDRAFYGKTSLTSVTIPGTITTIGVQALFGCISLTNITIPGSVTTIGFTAFYNCASLMAITVDAANAYYSSAEGVLFDKNLTMLIQYPGGKSGSYQVPGGVIIIGDYAFSFSTSLTSVAIPGSVTSIGNGAFSYCASLISVTIANGLASIGNSTFYACTSLTNITIPGTVTSIDGLAFQNCSSLKGAFFEGNAPSFSSGVFSGDNNAIIYYLPGTTGWGATFADRPTRLWNPLMQSSGPSFGVRTNRFGFTITWANNRTVVVEAATNLANPAWVPVGTNTLTGGASYFSDPEWTNHPARFYRLRSP